MIRAFLSQLVSGHKQTWWEGRFIWIVGISTIVFMGICMAIGLQQSVWFDEAYSIMLAKQPAVQLVHLTALDTHPPLYYLLLKAWATLFGWGEFALRSLSVLMAGLAVFFAALTARRMFGAKIALTALPFIIFAPFLLRYGFEIRMYSTAAFIGMAATYVLVRALQTKRGREQWLLYGLYAVLVALGTYTLYYTVLLWLTHAVWLIWISYRSKKSIAKQPWLRAYIISIILFLPWLPAFVSQISNGALAAISQPLTIDNLVGIISFEFLYRPMWQLGALLSLVMLGVIATIIIFVIDAFKKVSAKQREYLVLLAMYVAVPVVIVAVVSLARPLYVERYLAHVAIGGMLFIGVVTALRLQKATAKTKIAAGTLVLALGIGIAQLAVVGNYNFQRLQRPMVKQAAMISKCDTTSSVFAADPYVAIELAYYLPECQIYFYSQTATLKGGYAPLSNSPLHVSDTAKELGSNRTIYYVYYGEQEMNMPANHKQVDLKTFDALRVATFSVE